MRACASLDMFALPQLRLFSLRLFDIRIFVRPLARLQMQHGMCVTCPTVRFRRKPVGCVGRMGFQF